MSDFKESLKAPKITIDNIEELYKKYKNKIKEAERKKEKERE